MQKLTAHSLFKEDIQPQDASTDAVNGVGAAFDGYNMAYYVFQCGAPVDSDDTIAFLLQKNTETNVVSDAASSDWANLSTDSLSVTFTTSDGGTDIYVGYVELEKHGLTTGLLRGKATLTGESDTCAVSSMLIFMRKSGTLPASFDQTVKEWAT